MFGKKPRATKFIILCILIVLLAASPMIPTVIIYNQTFGGRAESPAYRAFLRYGDPYFEHITRRIVNFPSGRNMLTGYIYGEDNYKGLIVIAHSFGDGAEGYFNVIKYFVDNGWRVFAYDNTGSHKSEGSTTRGLTQSALDLNAALTFIADQDWELPIMLFGHSWGGFAVTAVLNFEHDISAVVSLAGYNTAMQVLRDNSGHMLGRASAFAYPYLWVHQRLIFGRYAGLSAVSGINRSDIPVKIIHGTQDWLILYDSAGIIAHREDITNSNAVFVTHYLEHNNNHMNLLMSQDAFYYITELDQRFMELFYRYIGENEPACVFTAIYFHHVHMLTNKNLASCFCSRIYDSYIPRDVLSEFYSNIDRHMSSELNSVLMDEINAFFMNALKTDC